MSLRTGTSLLAIGGVILELAAREVARQSIPYGGVDIGVWRSGVNRLRFDFAWASRPVDVGIGGDTRLLSAAVDYVRVAKR